MAGKFSDIFLFPKNQKFIQDFHPFQPYQVISRIITPLYRAYNPSYLFYKAIYNGYNST